MTVLVTTSLTWRTLVRDGFCFFCSAKRALRAASQSKTEWTERALKGDLTVLALIGESKLLMAGLGGSFKLGKEARLVGGADMGNGAVNGPGGMSDAVAGEEGLLLALDVGERRSSLEEHLDLSLVAVPGAESGVVSPDTMAGELRDMALDRKSVYAEGGLIGVLMKSGSGLMAKIRADLGVAVLADEISEGKVLVTGVESFPSLGLVVGGMVMMLIIDKEQTRSSLNGIARGCWGESRRGRMCDAVEGRRREAGGKKREN